MGWSLSVEASKGEAREVFTGAHRWQEAYQVSGASRVVMDQVCEFAAQVARAAPEGVKITLTSNGQVNEAGMGNCNVSLTFYPAK
jgi:hypothetical protein